jgi:hypothetical protein
VNGTRAGLVYLGLAAGGIWLLVTGNLAKLQGRLTAGVLGTPDPTIAHPIQGPSFPRAGAISAVVKAGQSPIAS